MFVKLRLAFCSRALLMNVSLNFRLFRDAVIILSILGGIKALFGGSSAYEKVSAKSLSELSAKAISGRTVDFASFKGKPVLVVNVASK